MSDYFEISSESPETKITYQRVHDTPEMTALFHALDPHHPPHEPGRGKWDYVTKGRVEALHYKTAAEYWRSGIEKEQGAVSKRHYEELARENDKKAAYLLPEGTEHLTLDEVRALVDQIVDRELSKLPE